MNAEASNWLNPRLEELNRSLAALADEEGVAFRDRGALVCAQGQASCELLLPDGRKALYDYGHWTPAGAQHFGRQLGSWLEVNP